MHQLYLLPPQNHLIVPHMWRLDASPVASILLGVFQLASSQSEPFLSEEGQALPSFQSLRPPAHHTIPLSHVLASSHVGLCNRYSNPAGPFCNGVHWLSEPKIVLLKLALVTQQNLSEEAQALSYMSLATLELKDRVFTF
jgi:hypothetical protein